MTEVDPIAAVQAAGDLWDEPERAEAILLQAMAKSPESETVLIALYRFYFYRSDLAKAVLLAERCVVHGAKALGLDGDWRTTPAAEQDFGDYALPRHRFYLFSLNAYGYLLARLGRTGESEAVLSTVKRLDPHDRIGGGHLLDVIRAGPDQD